MLAISIFEVILFKYLECFLDCLISYNYYASDNNIITILSDICLFIIKSKYSNFYNILFNLLVS